MSPQARIYYELSRLNAMEDWWQYAVLIAVLVAILGYVYWMYRRDWVELPKPLGWALLLLRVLAFVGLLLFFLDLQKRSEQPIVKASKLAVLVDNSLSMTLPAGDLVNESGQVDSPLVALDPEFPQENRVQQVQRVFTNSELLTKLAEHHEVTVYQFGQEQRLAPIASFPKTGRIDDASILATGDTAWNWRMIAWVVWTGTALLGVGLSITSIAIFSRLRSSVSGRRQSLAAVRKSFSEHHPDAMAYLALAGVVASILGLVCIGTAAVRTPEYRFSSLWSWTEPAKRSSDEAQSPEGTPDPASLDAKSMGLAKLLLSTQATETRIGDAISAVLVREQDAPLAGIVVFSDGQNNAGLSLDSAGGQATAAGIPIYTVGLGSALDPINARIVDMNAPRRVFPGDPIRIAATGASFRHGWQVDYCPVTPTQWRFRKREQR